MTISDILHQTKPVSPCQTAMFRIVLGIAIACNCLASLPSMPIFFTLGTILGLTLARGKRCRASCLLLFAGCLYLETRNHSTPSADAFALATVLLLLASLPHENICSTFHKRQDDRGPLTFPWIVYATAWALLVLIYGTEAWHRIFILDISGGGQSITALQLFFCLSSFHRLTRAWGWTAMFIIQLTLLLFVPGTDSMQGGLILLHFFLFDPEWFPPAADGRQRLVFFDGICMLCENTVHFLLAEDRSEIFRFTTLQGKTASEKLAPLPEGDGVGSVIYFLEGSTHNEQHDRSEAVLRILNDLGGLWRVLSWARIIPRTLRDAVYNHIATHRYQWFGKHDACISPSPENRFRFLP